MRMVFGKWDVVKQHPICPLLFGAEKAANGEIQERT